MLLQESDGGGVWLKALGGVVLLDEAEERAGGLHRGLRRLGCFALYSRNVVERFVSKSSLGFTFTLLVTI